MIRKEIKEIIPNINIHAVWYSFIFQLFLSRISIPVIATFSLLLNYLISFVNIIVIQIMYTIPVVAERVHFISIIHQLVFINCILLRYLCPWFCLFCTFEWKNISVCLLLTLLPIWQMFHTWILANRLCQSILLWWHYFRLHCFQFSWRWPIYSSFYHLF